MYDLEVYILLITSCNQPFHRHRGCGDRGGRPSLAVDCGPVVLVSVGIWPVAEFAAACGKHRASITFME